MWADGFEAKGIMGNPPHIVPFGKVLAVQAVIFFESIVLWENVGKWFDGVAAGDACVVMCTHILREPARAEWRG